MPSGKVTDKYASHTTITFEESDCYKAKFKPNQFNSWIENDCFQELIKLIEQDNIDNLYVSFSDEITPSQDDRWHYLNFTEDNKLQLPTKSMWGISEENNWEAKPRLSFESKKVTMKTKN